MNKMEGFWIDADSKSKHNSDKTEGGGVIVSENT
jgi:hypothetical protein